MRILLLGHLGHILRKLQVNVASPQKQRSFRGRFTAATHHYDGRRDGEDSSCDAYNCLIFSVKINWGGVILFIVV